jgi:hypothetical protein
MVRDNQKAIRAIRSEQNTEKRLEMLLKLNESLPQHLKLQIPSLITNAYVRRALDLLEERTLVSEAAYLGPNYFLFSPPARDDVYLTG